MKGEAQSVWSRRVKVTLVQGDMQSMPQKNKYRVTFN